MHQDTAHHRWLMGKIWDRKFYKHRTAALNWCQAIYNHFLLLLATSIMLRTVYKPTLKYLALNYIRLKPGAFTYLIPHGRSKGAKSHASWRIEPNKLVLIAITYLCKQSITRDHLNKLQNSDKPCPEHQIGLMWTDIRWTQIQNTSRNNSQSDNQKQSLCLW